MLHENGVIYSETSCQSMVIYYNFNKECAIGFQSSRMKVCPTLCDISVLACGRCPPPCLSLHSHPHVESRV